MGETPSALEATALTGRARPRILLLSLTVSRANGAAVLAALRRRSPRTKVILLPKAVRAVDAGEVQTGSPASPPTGPSMGQPTARVRRE